MAAVALSDMAASLKALLERFTLPSAGQQGVEQEFRRAATSESSSVRVPRADARAA